MKNKHFYLQETGRENKKTVNKNRLQYFTWHLLPVCIVQFSLTEKKMQ